MIQNNTGNLKNCLIVIFLKEFSNAGSKTSQKAHNSTKKGMTTERVI